jgi:N-methylhydantoinase A/oxoprolinase/acetone carboxylase beta subunit
MRYRGQAYNLTVALGPRPVTRVSLKAAEQSFHAAHRAAYDYTPSVTDTEVVTLRLRATSAARPISWNGASGRPQRQPSGERRAWLDGGWVGCRIVERSALEPGERLAGPAIVEQGDATTLVATGWRGWVADAGLLVLDRSGS